MDISEIKRELSQKGFCIVPDALTSEEVEKCVGWFRDWQKSIPDHDYQHNKLSPHGIYKFHEAGHQRHSWYIRTHPRIKEIFQGLWDTKNLIVSFDGSCYIPKSLKKYFPPTFFGLKPLPAPFLFAPSLLIFFFLVILFFFDLRIFFDLTIINNTIVIIEILLNKILKSSFKNHLKFYNSNKGTLNKV